MELAKLISDLRIQAIITPPDEDSSIWKADLENFISGDINLTRHSAGESAICAIQRLLIFLGYSTSSSGAFAIDGDFGRGTNRSVAQFQFEHDLPCDSTVDSLCYPCKWNTARSKIIAIPEAILTLATLKEMLIVALKRCDNNQVMAGDFDTAIFHLNALHRRQFLNCRKILQHYGEPAQQISQKLSDSNGTLIRAEWILSIIKQETAGVIRPRFEQHYLTRLKKQHPNEPITELRMRSMSHGLGQIMGTNFKAVGATTASDLFTAPVSEQVAFVARFLKPKRAQTRKANPSTSDFHKVARFYNGPKYEAHHYHESIARWFREFQQLM